MTITISAKTPQFIRQEGAAIVAQPGTTVDCDDWRARWLIKNGFAQEAANASPPAAEPELPIETRDPKPQNRDSTPKRKTRSKKL